MVEVQVIYLLVVMLGWSLEVHIQTPMATPAGSFSSPASQSQISANLLSICTFGLTFPALILLDLLLCPLLHPVLGQHRRHQLPLSGNQGPDL